MNNIEIMLNSRHKICSGLRKLKIFKEDENVLKRIRNFMADIVAAWGLRITDIAWASLNYVI